MCILRRKSTELPVILKDQPKKVGTLSTLRRILIICIFFFMSEDRVLRKCEMSWKNVILHRENEDGVLF